MAKWTQHDRSLKVRNADGEQIAYCRNTDIARRIVRACNAHDDLLEACEAMVHAAQQGDSALGGVAATLAAAAIANAVEATP